jgi:hypothetical protein
LKHRALAFTLGLLVACLLAGILAPAALAYRMDVPVWKQSDPRWAALHLDGSSYTMAGSGCAVTSCAMVAAYYGSSKDPGGLCRALSANGGLDSSGSIYWQKVPSAAGGTIRYIGRWDYDSVTLINQELDAGYPVIAEAYLQGSAHWVVLTGRAGSTYYINDPGYGDRTTLNARYGSVSTAIHGFRLYHGSHTTLPPPSPYTRYQQTDSRFCYTGTWPTASNNSASGGSWRYINTSGGSVTIPFTGTYLAWVTVKSPNYGIAEVTLDGGTPVPVDLYSASTAWQQTVWNTGTLPTGLHTVTIAWTGTKNPAAAATYIGLDAVDVGGSLTPTTRVEQTDSHLVWAGAWTTASSSIYSGGSFAYANASGASVTVNFSGVKLTLIGTTAYSYGKMKVTLDGTSTFTVDLYTPTALYKQTLWSSGLLPLGDHTVTLEWTGDKNPSSSNTYVSLDAVDVIGSLR